MSDLLRLCVSRFLSTYSIKLHTYQRLKLYAAGARNFLFFDVPAVDRVPQGSPSLASFYFGDRTVTVQFSLTAVQRARLAQYIEKFNAAMQTMVKVLRALYPHANVWLFDTNTLFHRVLDNPSRYRTTAIIQNTTNVCGPYAQ